MTVDQRPSGWNWFEGEADDAASSDEQDVCRAAARCLSTSDGTRLLEHLKASILERRLGPATSDAELRHVEGQRFAIAHIVALYERGGGR
jgi:hypothetical protein